MEERCSRLNHDMESCQGVLGQYNRCEWSHGVNYNSASKSYPDLEAMSKSSSHDDNQHHESFDEEEEVSVKLGCIWDETGCASGCDVNAMETRCGRMSHDQEMCEGEIGAFNRCLWSHGDNPHMSNLNVDVHFSDFGEDSTLDILLIIAGVVTAVFVTQQVYRWWRNREYKKVRGTQHHEEIQITSHVM